MDSIYVVGYETMLHLSQRQLAKSRGEKMKIFAVDVDGVLAHLSVVWMRLYNKDYNDNLTEKEWNTWNIDKIVKPECGKKIYRYIEDPHIYDEVEPYPGAQKGIDILKAYYRVIFVTTGTQGAAGRKFQWLKDWKFSNNFEDYYECKDKSLVYSDYLIDDYIKNVTAPVPYGSRINILFDQPWNEKFSYSPRMKDWNNIYNFIKQEKK